jgi:lysophospholipase L1-like esterase
MAWMQSPVVYAAWVTRCRSMTTPAVRAVGRPACCGAARLLWRNRDHDFPAWTGRDLTARDPTARLALLASDGATSAAVAGEQLGRLRRLGLTPTLATVTMGGNDLLAAYGDATAGRRAIRTVMGNGRLVLGGLRSLMGTEAPIVVATVYDPSDASGNARQLGLPPWAEALEARLCHDRQRACLVWPCTRQFRPRVWNV